MIVLKEIIKFKKVETTFSRSKNPCQNRRFTNEALSNSIDKTVKKLKQGKNSFDRGGRNNQGVITVFHRGGRNKRNYRLIDFKRTLFKPEKGFSSELEGTVVKIEYDPNRTAKIALVYYKGGLLSYIIAPKDLEIGDKVFSGDNTSISKGNACPIGNMPVGTLVHNIELKPGKGGQLARAAGTFAKIIKKEGSYVSIKLKSGKLYSVPHQSMATVGIVSNELNKNSKLTKAGNNRWKGRRPTVRGVAMNPVDHPHGGGEGRSKGGRHPVTPWGKLTKGKPTSFEKKTTNRKFKRKNKD